MRKSILIFIMAIIGYSSLYCQSQLYSWGVNTNGQLGNTSVVSYRTTPIQVGTASNWKEIACGERYSIAIRTDGTLWAWGLNTYGQLGDGTTETRTSPVQIGPLTTWTKISCGLNFTIAMRSDGSLWAWGLNTYGQLGDGTNINRLSPVQIAPLITWAKIACGNNHTLAISSGGLLYAWGDNAYAQLGNNSNINSSSPIQIGIASNWTDIAAGSRHSLAIQSQGLLFSWGNNSYGQLGTSNNTEYKTPTQVGSSSTWSKVSSGTGHSMALRTDNSLWGWGYNAYGQIGSGTTQNSNSPIQIVTSSNWINFACGADHTLLLKSDSTLWAVGRNVCGQIGDGTQSTRLSPVQIGLYSNWAKIAGGTYHTLALKKWSSLAEPTLVFPVNGVAQISKSPTLIWHQIIDASQYRLQVSTDPSFSSFFVNTSIIADTFITISGLNNSSTYYWRVCAGTGTDSSAWSEIRYFITIPVELADYWSFTPNTGYSANIGLKSGGTFEIGDRAIQAGDAIGAFYSDGDEKKCAGYFVWDDVNRGFVVWGDDNITSSIKEGFSLNENFTFRIWDALEYKSYPADFEIESGNTSFTYNGITVIKSITANMNTSQDIALINGWNMISSYIIPTNDTMPEILDDIDSQITLIKNFSGESYWKPYMENLNNWNYKEAYITKTNAVCTLSMRGRKLLPDTTKTYLQGSGWKWIPYYRDNPLSPALALTSISGNYILIKSIDGKTYWPGNTFTLTNMEPGKGYMIYMTATDTLTYPSNFAIFGKLSADAILSIQELNNQYFIGECSNTGSSAVLSIKIKGADSGDEVGVFTQSGKLVGSGIYESDNIGLTIWGDDYLTEEIDGAKEGEAIYLKLYKPVYSKSADVIATNILDCISSELIKSLVYKSDAIYKADGVIGELGIETSAAKAISINPIPAINNTMISYYAENSNKITISIYDSQANLIFMNSFNAQVNSINKFNIDLSKFNSGVYNVVLIDGAKNLHSKLVVIK